MKQFKNYSFLSLAIAGFVLAFLINQKISKPAIIISKQEATWNLNNEMVQKFHLGFKRLQSSFLWISTIIESDLEHYNAKDLNSWMFLRFSTIARLEPHFYENYNFGGIYLSIVKDDLEGATAIYKMGLAEYPNDFKLLRDASFHFFHETKDYKMAYQISQKIKTLYPEKKYLVGMITKLEAEYGRLEDALQSLDLLQMDYPQNTFIGDKIYQNRYALKAEIDLNCLNSDQKELCSLYDLNNDQYINKDKGYAAKQKWIPYRKKSLNKSNKK